MSTRSAISFDSTRGREVAALLTQNPNVRGLAKTLGVKASTVRVYRYAWIAAGKPTGSRAEAKPTNGAIQYHRSYGTGSSSRSIIQEHLSARDAMTTRYPNGGVSAALVELTAEAARIQAAISALKAVTLSPPPRGNHVNKPFQVYQGDIGFIAVPALPKGRLTVVPAEGNRLIVARGEVTGHHHSLPAATATLNLDEGRTMWLTLEELTAVEHQEHDTVTLPPGIYRIGAPGMQGGQRQWSDAMEPIRVSD